MREKLRAKRHQATLGLQPRISDNIMILRCSARFLFPVRQSKKETRCSNRSQTSTSRHPMILSRLLSRSPKLQNMREPALQDGVLYCVRSQRIHPNSSSQWKKRLEAIRENTKRKVIIQRCKLAAQHDATAAGKREAEAHRPQKSPS